jgi:glycosyltransferase involved in cell wall biosynthesis
MANASPFPRIAYLLNFFPMISETFIISEIQNLKNLGVKINIYSLFHPESSEVRQDVKELLLITNYVSDEMNFRTLLSNHLYFLFRRPRAYFQTLIFAFEHRNQSSLFRTFLTLLRTKNAGDRHKISPHDRQNVLVHFILTPPLARRILKGQFDLIHAQYANATASFAMLASMLTKIQYIITTHATDLFVKPELLSEKFKRARLVITCTKYNQEYIREKYPLVNAENVHVIYHGLNVNAFQMSFPRRVQKHPVLLSIGRLVPKKGFRHLLRACKILKEREIPFACTIIGDGPDRGQLELYVRLNQLTDFVSFVGAIPPTQVRDYYEGANIFVLPCVIDSSGDRDGIPNVIAEAMAMELPVISTTISGIPEIVINGETGILVDPNEIDLLVDAVLDLSKNPEKALQMGRKGRERILNVFDMNNHFQELATLLQKLKI